MASGLQTTPPSKPKVLILDRFFFPDEQATSVYLTELVEGLSSSFEFTVLSGPPVVVTENLKKKPLGAKIFQVPSFRFSKPRLFFRFLNDLSFLKIALLKGLFLPRPHLLLSQTSPPGIWWVGFLLSRWHRVPWIHVSKDVFPENLRVLAEGRAPFLFQLLEKINRWVLKKADRVLVI